jgi:hypothetical protein
MRRETCEQAAEGAGCEHRRHVSREQCLEIIGIGWCRSTDRRQPIRSCDHIEFEQLVDERLQLLPTPGR